MSSRLLLILAILSAISLSTAAATYTVTTTADAGSGSLRAAFDAVNSLECAYPCTIRFAIPAPVPESGYFTIRPLSPLPVLFGDAITIDGASQTGVTGDTNREGPEIELDGSLAGYRSGIKLGRVVGMTLNGLAVNRFEGHGIFIDNSSGIVVSACYVGVDPTARHARPNGLDGIAVRGVYGGVRLYGNTIGGNRSNGVYVAGHFGVDIAGNRIGVGTDGTWLGNGANGVDIVAGDARVVNNDIAHNAHFGIVVGDGAARSDLVDNRMHSNGLMSIGLGHDGHDPADPLDADSGANGRINSPVLTSARADASLPGYFLGEIEYTGSVEGKPNTAIRIDAYASPNRGPLGFAEVKLWFGSDQVRTDASGRAHFSFSRGYGDTGKPLLVSGGWLSATATTHEGTSELGLPVPISAGRIEVSTLADSGPGSLRDAIDFANSDGCEPGSFCRITFAIPADQLRNGVAVFEPRSALPGITNGFVQIDGSSQTWTYGDTNPNGPEVEIRGNQAGDAAGLRIGSSSAKVERSFIHAIAVTGFRGDGISVDATEADNYEGYDVRLSELVVGLDPATGEARGNSGDGISIRGMRSGGPATRWTVRDSTVGANGGNGIRVDASGANVTTSRIGLAADGTARPNGGAGVFVGAQALDATVSKNTIAFNARAGVATGPEARAVYIESSVHSNGALGIDRNDDGLGSGSPENVTPRPSLQSATFDPLRNVTVVEGELGEGTPSLSVHPGSGSEMRLNFYVSSVPDPSGFGEGADHATGPGAYSLVFTGRTFRGEIPFDLRGKYLTATTSFAICFWEFGCHGRDTSEFSNAVAVN
ncbi:MAG: right-handed parallel beta-helix repeat-containing protein [Thermoanaerobaculia bacterium]